jgi:RHS repeat-associated protein
VYDIDPATGLICLEEEDWSLNGDMPLFLTRRYNNLSQYAGPFGVGWMCGFDSHLRLNGPAIEMIDPQGRQVQLPGLWEAGSSRDRINGYVAQRTGNHFEVFDPGGLKLTFLADALEGRYQLVRQDEIGENSLWFFYDGPLLSEVQSSSGHIIRLVRFDDRIQAMLAVSDGQGAKTLARYRYDRGGHLISVADPSGSACIYEYSSGLLTRRTNRLGGSNFFAYDDHRRCIRTWQDPAGRVRFIEYDDKGQRTLVTDSAGRRTELRFDAERRLQETIRFDGSSIREFYTNSNEPTATEGDPEPDSLYEYDDHGNNIKEIEPDGAEWTWSYDPLNRIVAETEPDGGLHTFHFDDANRVLQHRDSLGGVTSFEYDEVGRVIATTLPLGNVVRAGRDRGLTQVADSLGPLYTAQEDYFGNPVEIRNASGSVTRFTNDDHGRITAISSNGHTATSTYDAEGNLTAETDFVGNLSGYERDAFGRLVRWNTPTGISYSYHYDAEGRLVDSSSSAGPRCEFERDWQGRLTRVRLRDGREEKYVYDENGNRSSVVQTGQIRTEYDYTPVGLISGIRHGSLSAAFSYDAMGNLTEAVGDGHVVKRTNGTGELVVRETQDEFEIDYEYNAVGLVTKRTDAFGRTTQYDYNVRGQLTSLQDSIFGEFKFEYDASGSLSLEILPNGLTRNVTFDSEDELRESETQDNNARTLQRRSYRYDGNGEITQEISLDGVVTDFHYDAGRQLTLIRNGDVSSESFEYDGDENLISYQGIPLTYEGSELISGAGWEYEYDAAGRVVRRGKDGENYTFEYGLGGLISKAVLPDGSSFSYEYDGLGRRVLKRGPAETVRYFWDAETLLAETRTTAESESTRFYLFLPDTFIPLGHADGDRRFYYENDQRGAVREVYDEHGKNVAQFRYLGFGSRYKSEGGTAAADVPFRLLGQYFDRETGLHYNRFRYFDPDAGRFLSIDLWSHEIETNPYSYGPNPIGWADPLGLARLGDFSRSQANNIKEANRKKNRGFYKCANCGFKNKNKVFAVSKETGRPVGDGAFHADHKKSLGRGGSGNPNRNGQALGGTCNCSKGKRKKAGMT